MNRTTRALLADYHLVTRVEHAIGALAQRLVYSDEELLVSLSNSLKLREREIADLGSFTSRLMSLFVGKDAGDSIRIDGMRLKQLHDLAGSRPRAEIDLNGIYSVKLAYFRVLLSKARKAAETNAGKFAAAPVPR
jgi:hypothetical protein